jgi:hypothetical protein
MQPELIKDIENSPINTYCGILRNEPIKVDIQTIINNCWIAWSNNFSDDISDYEIIFQIILKANGIRVGNFTGFAQDDYIPLLDAENKMDFMYIDMDYYTDDLRETNFLEVINGTWNEKQFKMLFTNYLTWLGYEQK